MEIFKMRLFIVCIFVLTAIQNDGIDAYLRPLPDDEKTIYKEDVTVALNNSETSTFISTFNTSLGRDIITKHLESCIFMFLCGHYWPSINKWYTGYSCCLSCSCDFPNCLKRMTCCLDTLVSNMDTDNFLEEDNQSQAEDSCVPLYLGDPLTTNIDKYQGGAYMINTCPDDSPVSLVENCTRLYTFNNHDINDTLPVMSTANNVAYRNMYCAYCNNMEDYLLRRPVLQVDCNDSDIPLTNEDIIKATVQDKKCNMLFHDSLYDPILCTLTVDECNKTGNWLEFDGTIKGACKMYLQPIFIEDLYYKNPFCAMCNGINIQDHYECDSGHRPNAKFSGLLKLESENKGPVMVSDGKCTSKQIYDSFLNVCRDIHCPPLTNFNNGECLNTYDEVKLITYNLYLKIIPLYSTTVEIAYFASEYILEYLQKLQIFYLDSCGVQVMQHCGENIKNKSYEEALATEIEYFKVRVQTSKINFHNQFNVYEDYYQLHNSTHSIRYFMQDTNKIRKLEVLLLLDDFNPEQFDIIAKLSVSIINQNMNKTYSTKNPLPLKFVLNNFIFSDHHTGSNIPYIKENFHFYDCGNQSEHNNVNVMHYKRCPKVFISQGEVDWVQNDDGIMFINENFNVPHSEFFIDFNDNIIICYNFFKKYMSLIKEVPTEAILIVSTVCIVFSSMSILALFLTLIVFLLIPRLRQFLPGKINISLVLVLLCAQCMYLVGSFAGISIGTWECIVIGIALHYLWILSFMWMNIATYHMYCIVTKTKIISNTLGLRRFIVYHAYAAIMAALPVVINIIVSLITSGTTGYGDTQCYISSQIMIICTFAIPLGLVLLGNVSMFVLVVFINKRPTIDENTLQLERNALVMFVKLTILTGVTWLFGLIYSWTNIMPLSYIFIVLNAGQGIFVMYSLILNKPVLSMFNSDVLGRNSTDLGDTAPTEEKEGD